MGCTMSPARRAMPDGTKHLRVVIRSVLVFGRSLVLRSSPWRVPGASCLAVLRAWRVLLLGRGFGLGGCLCCPAKHQETSTSQHQDEDPKNERSVVAAARAEACQCAARATAHGIGLLREADVDRDGFPGADPDRRGVRSVTRPCGFDAMRALADLDDQAGSPDGESHLSPSISTSASPVATRTEIVPNRLGVAIVGTFGRAAPAASRRGGGPTAATHARRGARLGVARPRAVSATV